jgi:hypothetical protein
MTSGQSGAPLVSDNVARAVALGVVDSSENSAVVLDDPTVAFIKEVVATLQ